MTGSDCRELTWECCKSPKLDSVRELHCDCWENDEDSGWRGMVNGRQVVDVWRDDCGDEDCWEDVHCLNGNINSSKTTCLEIYNLFVVGSRHLYPLLLRLYPRNTQSLLFVSSLLCA